MTIETNLQVMRRAIDAFRAGDVATLSQVFANEVVWHVPGTSFLAGTYSGQQETFAYFGRLMELTHGTFKVESIDMLANEHGGVFVDRLTAERDGRTLDLLLLLHVTIKNGQITEGFDCYHQEHVWDAFWKA